MPFLAVASVLGLYGPLIRAPELWAFKLYKKLHLVSVVIYLHT